MDSSRTTAPELAADLGVSLPRVHRLLDDEGVPPTRGRGHQREVDSAIGERLERRVGAVPVRAPGLSRTDMMVLAAVSRAALGLESVRAVSRAARVSPTAAGKSLKQLEERGLVKQVRRRLVQGRPRTVSLWQASSKVMRTTDIAHAVSKVRLPDSKRRGVTARASKVPPRFHHLFWSGNPQHLDLKKDSDFVAVRLMNADDPDAWTWALANLPKSSIRKAAKMRGVTPPRRALISNLAKSL